MGRIIKSVSLSPELNEVIEENISDFSKYIQDCLKIDFHLEYLKKKNIEDLKKISERKILIKKLEKEKKTSDKNKQEVVDDGGIKETIKRPGRTIFKYK